MKVIIRWFVMWLCVAVTRAASPFEVVATAQQQAGQPVVRVALKIPAQHFIYVEHLKISAAGAQLVPLAPPPPGKIHDKFSDADKEVFDRDTRLEFAVNPPAAKLDIQVEFQGCNDSMCFFPETKIFSLTWAGLPAPQTGPSATTNAELAAPSAQHAEEWATEASRFNVAATAAGYLDKEKFLTGLDSTGSQAAQEKAPAAPAVSCSAACCST